MAQNFSTNTPVRLQDEVFSVFVEAYSQIIDQHGASFAVNTALAQHLRNIGFSVSILETPAERIARSQRKRWKSVKAADAEAAQREQAKLKLKRDRDARYRAKRKAAKVAQSKSED